MALTHPQRGRCGKQGEAQQKSRVVCVSIRQCRALAVSVEVEGAEVDHKCAVVMA
jgi:hypothetical protein